MDGFAKLSRLIANLDTLGLSGADDVSEEAASNIANVIDTQYQEGRGPDGKNWAPKADGTASHLQETGAMRAGTKVSGVKGVAGVRVTIPKPGGFHQGGTVKMDARPLVPEDGALPETWAKAVSDAAKSVVTKGLGK